MAFDKKTLFKCNLDFRNSYKIIPIDRNGNKVTSKKKINYITSYAPGFRQWFSISVKTNDSGKMYCILPNGKHFFQYDGRILYADLNGDYSNEIVLQPIDNLSSKKEKYDEDIRDDENHQHELDDSLDHSHE